MGVLRRRSLVALEFLVYAIAFQLTGNLLVLWPLLTPLGSFFAKLDAGDIELSWAYILGFLDVAALMVTVLVVAHRHERRARVTAVDGMTRQPRGPAGAPETRVGATRRSVGRL
jgi:hypothetical protein